jgi:hypothetical protein
MTIKQALTVALPLCVAVLGDLPALAQTASVTLSPTTVLVNPVTAAGTATITLRNPPAASGNSQAAPIDVVLKAVPSDGTWPNTARVTFASETAPDRQEQTLEFRGQRPVESVQIVVQGIHNVGDYSIDVYDRATKIGTVAVKRAALGLAVDVPPENQSVRLTAGLPITRVLTNADPFPYAVQWNWSADGVMLCGDQTYAPPHGTVLLTCTPSKAGSLRELFRQSVTQSVLALHAGTSPASGSLAALKLQSIPVTVTSMAPEVGQLLTYIVLVLVLIAGGVTSLFLNTALPNFLQKLSLREQLLAVGIRIGNLSNNVESRIRVLVRLERSRLIDLLRSRWTLSPEFSGVVTQCTAGTTQLRSRVEALQQLDVVVENLANALHGDVPPTLVERIEALRRKANSILIKADSTDADLRDAITAVVEAATLVDTLSEPGEEFGIKLVARVKAVRDAAKTMEALPTWTRIKTAVPWPWNVVAAVEENATTVPTAQYVQLDRAIRRVEIMQQYAQLRTGRPDPDSPELRAQLEALTPEERKARPTGSCSCSATRRRCWPA